MADKRCENGHFIDASWDLCPYCPPRKKTSEIPIITPALSAAAFSSETRAVALPPRPRAVPPMESDVDSAPLPSVQSIPSRTVSAPRPEAVLSEGARFVVGWLVGLDGEARGESYPIRSGRNILGRDRRSDITIPDEQVSGHHADLVFRPEEGRFILMDHNSTNGTFVNGAEIEPRCNLTDRDVIRIGTHRYMFVAFCDGRFDWNLQG